MISVCMATYNGEKYIRQQLCSIISQIGEGDEVIISDDGSTDSTLDIVRNMADGRIRIVEGPCRQSPTLNFENALSHVKGDYIFLADQDDVWLPGKVSACMKWLGGYECVVSDAEMSDESLRAIQKSD